jgi:hypothetical protein
MENTMRGFELQKDRQQRLRQLRRARIGLEGTGQFYDLEDLGDALRAQLDIGWRHPLPRAFLAVGLLAQGLTRDQVAGVLGAELAMIPASPAPVFRLRPDAATALEDQVVAEIPETPEPGRFIRPQV